MPDYDNLRVTVNAISNGFLLTYGKDQGYSFTEAAPTFYPTMEAVESALVDAMRSAAAITRDTPNTKADF